MVSLKVAGMISIFFDFSHCDDVVLGRLETDGGALFVEHAHHQVDVDIKLVDRRELDLPAFACANHSATWRAATSSER